MNRQPAMLAIIFSGAAFALGCAGTMPPPDIRSLYTAAGAPIPRSDSALVEVYLKADAPKREYDVLGQIEIATEREGRTLENMLAYAKKEARRLGGEALVGLETDAMATPSTDGTTFPIYNVVTGKVIGYQSSSSDPGTRRVMKALIVKWRRP